MVYSTILYIFLSSYIQISGIRFSDPCLFCENRHFDKRQNAFFQYQTCFPNSTIILESIEVIKIKRRKERDRQRKRECVYVWYWNAILACSQLFLPPYQTQNPLFRSFFSPISCSNLYFFLT